jgi:hypothetical protein
MDTLNGPSQRVMLNGILDSRTQLGSSVESRRYEGLAVRFRFRLFQVGIIVTLLCVGLGARTWLASNPEDEMAERLFRSGARMSHDGNGHVMAVTFGPDMLVSELSAALDGGRTLPALQHLRDVDLRTDDVSDADFRCLCRPGLRVLRIMCPLTTSRSQAIAQLRQLEELHVFHSEMDCSSFKAIATLPSLQTAHFVGTTFDDECASTLSYIQSLKHVDISFTRVTDKGLESLARLPSLKTIVVKRTRVTREYVQRFKKLMPHVAIATDWPEGDAEP